MADPVQRHQTIQTDDAADDAQPTVTPMALVNDLTTFGHTLRVYQAACDNLIILAVDGLYLLGLINAEDNLVLPQPVMCAPTLADALVACDLIRASPAEDDADAGDTDDASDAADERATAISATRRKRATT